MDDIERYRRNRQEEVDAAFLYDAVADAESDDRLATVYRSLAETERDHAAFWTAKLTDAGIPEPDRRPGWRARVLARLAAVFGPQTIIPTLVGNERTGTEGYAIQPETAGTGMAADERSHERLLRTIDETTTGGMAGTSLARLEGRHRAASGNALRAAVLGANDGLVSNLALVMGVAGAALASGQILLTGLAGLVAGAGSMAMGEWLSVTSSRELVQRQLTVEAEELAAVPEEEAAELSLIYQAKGLSKDHADDLAEQLVADESTALDTLAREELGVDPEELGGSAWVAAGTSFVLFAFGATFPILPFALTTGTTAVVLSLAVSAVGLFLIGGAITLLTGRNALFSGARQTVFGLTAAALTYGVGSLVGATLVG